MEESNVRYLKDYRPTPPPNRLTIILNAIRTRVGRVAELITQLKAEDAHQREMRR